MFLTQLFAKTNDFLNLRWSIIRFNFKEDSINKESD